MKFWEGFKNECYGELWSSPVVLVKLHLLPVTMAHANNKPGDKNVRERKKKSSSTTDKEPSKGSSPHNGPSCESGMEKVLPVPDPRRLLVRLSVLRGQETTPAPALLVCMLVTIFHSSVRGQYTSAV